MEREAIVLANGRSLRLKPDTMLPKPLLVLHERSLLERQLDWLNSKGIDDIVLVTNFEVARHLNGDVLERSNLQLVVKPEPQGTAGDARSCFKNLTSEHIYIMNVDDLLDYEPEELFTAAGEHSAVCISKPRLPFGKATVRGNLVRKFEEKPCLNLYVSAGHYVFSKEALKLFPANGDIEKTVLPVLADSKKLKPLKLKTKQWVTINTYKDYLDAQKRFEVDQRIKAAM